jgi:hypothetical protein
MDMDRSRQALERARSLIAIAQQRIERTRARIDQDRCREVEVEPAALPCYPANQWRRSA